MTAVEFAALMLAMAAWAFARTRGGRPPLVLALLLAASLVTEVVAIAWGMYTGCNLMVYSLYQPAELALVLFLVRGDLRSSREWHLLWLCWAGYLGCFLWEWSSTDASCVFLTRTFITGCALLCILFALLVFRLTYALDRPLHRVPAFWLYLGFSIYYACMIPYIGLFNHFVHTDEAAALRLHIINEIVFSCRSLCILAACLLYIPKVRPAA